MSARKSKGKNEYNKPNFWGMMQNVLIASMNKGQFLLGVVGLAFLIMILKLTPEDTKMLLDDILSKLGNIYYIGWTLGIFSTFGWYFGTKRLRRIHSKEVRRISEEKKGLQQKVTSKKLRSSN
ncbi:MULTISPECIES: hypothetical protein [Tenacibaculum]|uniref:hypothetical protein n=1 Tax=Tenacibaculum TaxID=104267 RepID=UPI00073944EE|nr:hypothetical protein AUW17_08210 [Tenacibaculum dicentrarchi]MCD8405832.1 hypothetical protein [Tenacibaculum dicentrarchi]MCD8443147.1 hypothetical protein [Tenacibaculum dicentrarchi]